MQVQRDGSNANMVLSNLVWEIPINLRWRGTWGALYNVHEVDEWVLSGQICLPNDVPIHSRLSQPTSWSWEHHLGIEKRRHFWERLFGLWDAYSFLWERKCVPTSMADKMSFYKVLAWESEIRLNLVKQTAPNTMPKYLTHDVPNLIEIPFHLTFDLSLDRFARSAQTWRGHINE